VSRILALLAGLLFAGAAWAQTGTAQLSWTPPTQNTDGTPLGDLAGFKVYRGSSPTSFLISVTLSNRGLTSYVWDGLAAGTHYFVVTAINTASVESGFSNVAMKTIPGEPPPVVLPPGPVRNLVVTPVDPAARTPFWRLQYATGLGAATLPNAPTPGNLLVAIVAHRSGDAGSPTLSTAGWTARVTRPTLLANSDARRSLVVLTKTAGVNEPRALSVQWGAASAALQLQEFPAGWTFESASSSDTGTGSTSPLRTGSATGPEPRGSIAVAMWRSQLAAPSGISWGPAGVNPQTFVPSGQFPLVLSTTYGTELEYAVGWSGTGHEASAAVLVFR